MINKKVNAIIKKLDIILLSLILISSTILIRNEKAYQILQIAINIIAIIYFLIRNIRKNPIKIVHSKLDIFIIIFVFSSIVPLISNQYISLYATTATILKYITIFWLYVLAREITNKSNKNKEILTNVITGTTILLIALGIENLTTDRIFNILGIDNIINGESRLVSVFGNPNAFAGLIVFTFFLNIHKTIYESNSRKKTIYSTINTILILGLVMTYSKLMFIIFPFILLIYIFRLKDKNKIVYIIQNTIISLIISVYYIYEFNKLSAQENYLAILIFSIYLLILSILVNILNIKITQYLVRIKIRDIIAMIFIVVIVLGAFISKELKSTKEFIVFSENSNTNYNAKKINNIEPNKRYTFSFDMNAKMDLVREKDAEDKFTINIIQRDNKNVEITNNEEKFGDFSGVKDIEIYTTENTSEIKIEFKSKYQYAVKEWTIYNLKINGQNIVLEYKHLPTKLVEKIKDINIQYKTAQERFQFIKDGLKIISQNWITGIGGEGWQYKYEEVQDYGYTSNDTHSYFIQIWIEFGIIGIASFIGIVILIITQKDEKNKGIKFAILALLLHSLIDSDMYFDNMKLILFLSLGMISNIQELKIIKKRYYCTNALMIIIAVITSILYINPKIYQKSLIINEIETAQIGIDVNSEKYKELNYKLSEAYEKIIKYERISSRTNEYEVKKIQAYINSKQSGLEDIVKQYYERIQNYKNESRYSTDRIIEKSNSITTVMTMLANQGDSSMNQWIVKLAQINIGEFEENKNKIENAILKKYEKLEENRDYGKLLENNKYAEQMYNKYFLGIEINNTTQVDLKKYMQADSKFSIDNTSDIIIYHTHTTEGYIDAKDEEVEIGKTLNSNYNVLAIGETLKKELENKGFNTTHIQEYHDIEGINGAYARSKETIQNKLKEQENKIDIVFDVHRDAYIENIIKENTIEINGEKVANLRFVIAIGHEGWEENLKWAVELQKRADKIYPGLFKPLYIYDNIYNQSVSKCATLIEVGNNANTIDEAKRSMIYFSNIIKDVIENVD